MYLKKTNKQTKKNKTTKTKIQQAMQEKIILATKETRTTGVALPPTTTRGENKSYKTTNKTYVWIRC